MKKFRIRIWEIIEVPRLMDVFVEAKDEHEIIKMIKNNRLDKISYDQEEIFIEWSSMGHIKYDINSIEEIAEIKEERQ